MAGDKPQFLQAVPETEEERDIMSVLEDEPTKEVDNASPTEGEDKPTEGASDSDTPSSDGSDAPVGDNPTPTDTDTNSDNPTGSDEAGGDKKESAEDKAEDKKEEDVNNLLNLKFGNFKSAEEAEKAYKEMQRTLTKLTQAANKTPTTAKEAAEQKKAAEQYIEIAKNTPLVDVKIPKAENYTLSNGNFDMNGFSRDLVKNTVMAIQQGLIGGQLGSLQFGMMSEALGEEWQNTQAQAGRVKSAQAIENKLYETYPIIKNNEKIASLYEKAILGEYTQRKNRDGENFKPLEEADYLSIAEELVKNLNITSEPKKVEPADTPRGGGVIQPDGGKKLEGIDADIDAMMQSKKRTGSIF